VQILLAQRFVLVGRFCAQLFEQGRVARGEDLLNLRRQSATDAFDFG